MTKSKPHETAGGVVVNEQGKLLVLVRDIERDGAMRHEVRLPKGHIDPGESPEAAAVREVCEESGYCAVEIIADLGVGRSEFEFRGKHHTREERYYLMRLTRDERQPPAPTNDEEALFDAEWLAPEDARTAMTYASEQDFICRAIECLRNHNPGTPG